MAAAIKDEDLKEYPIIWADPCGKYRLIKRDEMNLEIIQYMRLGESGRGRQTEVRDCWCSVPMYYSSLVSAFNKLIELKMVETMTSGVDELKKICEALKDFKRDFETQCLKNIKNPLGK